jgi:hypothetical protein
VLAKAFGVSQPLQRALKKEGELRSQGRLKGERCLPPLLPHGERLPCDGHRARTEAAGTGHRASDRPVAGAAAT